MIRRTLVLLAALGAAAQDTAAAQDVPVITVAAGQRKRVWLGVLTMGTVYLKIRNDSGNCAKFFWRWGPIKHPVGKLCGNAQLSNYSPLAALWIERPETITMLAVSDDARAVDLTIVCKLEIQCPQPP